MSVNKAGEKVKNVNFQAFSITTEKSKNFDRLTKLKCTKK